MNASKKYVFIFATLSIVLLICALFQKSSSYKTETVKINNSTFKALVSDTEELRELGLSGRKSLGNNEAMLFIFDNSGFYGFWMKDMMFAIDIVWLDENFRVVSFEKNVSPSTYPKSFAPKSLAKYVLEFSSGTADRLNIKEGDILSRMSGK